jgi:hypothetical protein
MRPQVKLVLFSAAVALVLPNLYGISCDRSAPPPPRITAPASGSTIPVSGLFTASVNFPAALSASSLVEMELQTNQGATAIDVTSLFLPVGQTDFAGATSASADLDAIALGLSPGSQTFVVRVDVDGIGGAAIGLVGFTWMGSSECESMASAALSQCFVDANGATRQCYASTGSACSPSTSSGAFASARSSSSPWFCASRRTDQSAAAGALTIPSATMRQTRRITHDYTGARSQAFQFSARPTVRNSRLPLFGDPHAPVAKPLAMV